MTVIQRALCFFLVAAGLAFGVCAVADEMVEVGSVEAVYGGFVMVSCEPSQQVAAGEQVLVVRGDREIARLVVTQVREGGAVCRILAEAAAARVMPGDVVVRLGRPIEFAKKPPEEAQGGLVVRLIDAGFENVSVEETADGLFIRFENRKYRWEVEGLRRVLTLAAEELDGKGTITAVGHHLGVPIYQVEVPASEYQAFLEGRLSSDELLSVMRVSVASSGLPGEENKSFGRVDITYGAGLFGSFTTPSGGNPRGFQVRARMGVEAALAQGLFARAQEWVPLNSAGYSTHRSPARGLGYYTRNLGGRTFLTAEGGRFTQSFTGARGTLVHLLPSGADALWLEVARVTGKAGLGGKYHRTPLLVSWRHKLSGLDTTVVGRWGRFIGAPEVRRSDAWPYWVAETSEDKGYSLSLISAFRQKEFILSYADTNRGQLLAVGVILPLSARELPDPAGLRVRPEESFNYTYRSTGSARAVTLPDIPFTDDWRLLMFPAYLKDYVDYLRPGSEGLARVQRGVELRESIGPSLSGSTGLLMIPTADVEPYGSMSIGANFLGKRWRRYSGRLVGHGTMAQYITLGAVPSWEITVRLTNLKGNLWAQKFNVPDMDPKTADTGWNVDRMASVQWLALRETARRPSVAIGAQDVTADFGELGESVMYWERYAVASKHFGKLGVHMGLGGGHRGQEPRLKGLFGGLDYRFAKHAWLLMDIDRKFKFRAPGRHPEPDGREVNLGIRALLADRFQVDVFSPGLSAASAGLAYRMRL